MSRWDDLRSLGAAAKSKVGDADVPKLAGDALLSAQSAVEGAGAVAQRSGLTNKKGEISKVRVAKAVVTPRSSAKRLLVATADEVRARREGAPAGAGPEAEAEATLGPDDRWKRSLNDRAPWSSTDNGLPPG